MNRSRLKQWRSERTACGLVDRPKWACVLSSAGTHPDVLVAEMGRVFVRLAMSDEIRGTLIIRIVSILIETIGWKLDNEPFPTK